MRRSRELRPQGIEAQVSETPEQRAARLDQESIDRAAAASKKAVADELDRIEREQRNGG